MEPKKILYSVAVERAVSVGRFFGRPIWDISVSFLHAADWTEANFLYRAGNTQELVNFHNYKMTGKVTLPMRKIIAIAPAVYVEQNQDTGELTAD